MDQYLTTTYISEEQVMNLTAAVRRVNGSVCKQIVGSRDGRLFRTVFTSSSSLSSCTGMLAHITLRNASSSIIPAGPHFLAQSDTGYTCSIQYTLLSDLHAFIAKETCTPSKCSYPSAFFPPGTCMCMQMYLC